MKQQRPDLDELFDEAMHSLGAAIGRLARAYESDPDKRRDLLQEIYLAVWRSFAHFDDRCSQRTWVYRVAHNTAASYVIRQRGSGTLVCLEEIADPLRLDIETDRRQSLDRLLAMIGRLKPTDRQVILLYLEGLEAAAIAEISGLSARNVATKVHRIKAVLVREFQESRCVHD